MSTEDLDKVLAAADLHDRTYKLARSWGATEELAEVFASSQKEKFKWDGVNLIWNATGKVASDGEDCRAHFTQGPLKTLFPTANEDRLDVDPAMLASARAGNKTAQSQLFLKVGKDRAKLDTLLAEKPDAADKANEKPATEQERDNPWLPGKWSVTRQGQIYKLDPAMAARLAKAANSHIGATRPAKVA